MKKNNNSNSHLPNWQQGEHSTLSPLDRVEEMNIWLKKIHYDIINELKKIEEDDEPVGFVDL